MEIEALATLKIKFENWRANEADKKILMVSVYSEDGGYVGRLDGGTIKLLCRKGIVPQKRTSDSNTCSIGKSLIDGKWYGWSHRAIFGFEVGDKVKQGDCCASSGYTEEYLKEHPEEDTSLPIGFEAKTEEDCKKMACAFAESVS